MSIESVMPSRHLILCHPLLLLPPTPPSIRVLSNESTLRVRWPKYWSFSFSISPSNEHPGLISFRMDWLALLAVQGTHKSLLQHHNSKASIFRCSAFFTVQLSHPYMTTGKTIALTRWTFVGKVMSMLFNMLSRLVITFLPRSKCLLISWLLWVPRKKAHKRMHPSQPPVADHTQSSSHTASRNLLVLTFKCSCQVLAPAGSPGNQTSSNSLCVLSRFQGSSLPSNISSLPGPRNIIDSSSVDLKENTLNVSLT